MPWYTFRGPVRVMSGADDVEVDDEPRLRTLDGFTYDDETMAEQLEDPDLEEADIEGGTIELRWVEDHLEVRTAYEVAALLEPSEVEALRAFTLAQWESGIGEALVADCLAHTGFRVELAPEDDNAVEVEVEDG